MAKQLVSRREYTVTESTLMHRVIVLAQLTLPANNQCLNLWNKELELSPLSVLSLSRLGTRMCQSARAGGPRSDAFDFLSWIDHVLRGLSS